MELLKEKHGVALRVHL